MRWLVILGALALTGCATAPKPEPKPTIATPTCIPLGAYSKDQLNAMAAAVRALPPDSPLRPLVVEDARLRAADRACMASAPKP